jgi:intracellular sulfur oxidation DsrE/DsrF family protein
VTTSEGFRVVVQLADAEPGKHEAVIRNLINLRNDLGDEAVIELVAHGPAVALLLRSGPLADQVDALMREGLGLRACANSLRGQSIGPDQLIDPEGIVASGVGHVVRRQHEGWSYVRL